MTYSEWRRNYLANRNKFLKATDRDFERLLTRLRRQVEIPDKAEDFDSQKLREALDDYAESYEDTLRGRIGGAADFETEGALLLGGAFLAIAAKYVSEAVSNPAQFTPVKVVEKAFTEALPSGQTLSERIWDLRYAKDIETIVKGGIANGLSPEMLSNQLNGFILPGREVTTLTPYGRALNSDSMRLARTETMNAFRNAQLEDMRSTPWVTNLVWDGSGGCPEICQPLDGMIITGILPDTHPNCNCPVYEEVMDGKEWEAAMDAYITEGIDNIGIGDWLSG